MKAIASNMTTVECFDPIHDCAEAYELKYVCFEIYDPTMTDEDKFSLKKKLLRISTAPKEKAMVPNMNAEKFFDPKKESSLFSWL